MKPTLYDALGLSRTASEAEVKSALRRLVRRYYTRTRAGHADVEEALRFLNHASHILGNPARRAEYDATLTETAHAASSMTTLGGTFQAELIPPSDSDAGDSISQLGLPRDRAQAAPELVPELSAKLADIRRTPAGQLGALIAMAVVLIATWTTAVRGGEALSLLGVTIALLIAAAVVCGAVFGIVHLLSRSLWRLPAPESALSLVEGMIPRWRKDRTVFLGTGAPVEDATWLFRLRMAELKRVKAERVSDPRPAMRLLARLFDYAVWGLFYVAVVAALSRAGVIPDWLASAALHPLVAPVMVSLTWIPVEALMLTQLQTSPGRWLLCVYLQHGVSSPYAPEELRFTFGTAAGRALEVWWRGCAGWLPLVSLVAVARAHQLVKRSGETLWDSRRDCLVTHGPVGRLSFVTLGLGLLAAALAFASHWREPMQSMTLAAVRNISTPAPSPPRETKPLPPIVSVPQARISRLEDAPGSAPADLPPSPARNASEQAAATAPGSELSPSVASNRAMALESSPPAMVIRSDEPIAEPAATPGPPVPASQSPSAARPAAPAAPATAAAPAAPAAAAAPAAPAAAAAPAAPAAPATSSAPPATVARAPSPAREASQPQAPMVAAPAVTPSTGAPSAASSGAEPGSAPPSMMSSVKTYIAGLFRKPPPVEAPAPPPAPVEEKEKGPSQREVRERRVTEFLRQAQRQQNAGDFSGLIRTCTRWSEDDYKNPRAFYCLGLGLQGSGQHKEAIKMFNKAGSLLPRDDPLKSLIDEAVVRSFRAQVGGG